MTSKSTRWTAGGRTAVLSVDDHDAGDGGQQQNNDDENNQKQRINNNKDNDDKKQNNYNNISLGIFSRKHLFGRH